MCVLVRDCAIAVIIRARSPRLLCGIRTSVDVYAYTLQRLRDEAENYMVRHEAAEALGSIADPSVRTLHLCIARVNLYAVCQALFAVVPIYPCRLVCMRGWRWLAELATGGGFGPSPR